MPNLMLTDRCNRRCGYCFARGRIAQAGTGRDLPFHRLKEFLDFLDASGYPVLHLIGGEPTLHPSFANIVRYAVRRGFGIRLFTNGLMSDEAVEALLEIPPDRTGILVNVNEPRETPPAQWDRLVAVLGRLAPRVTAGYNLHRLDFDASAVVGLVRDLQLRPVLRLGLAQPIAGAANDHVPAAEYARLGEPVTRLAEEAAAAGVGIGFDCGFVACMFQPDHLRRLRIAGADVRFVCHAVLDVSPDLDLWGCFPLSLVETAPLARFPDLWAARDHFESVLAALRARAQPEACAACTHRRLGTCPGFCAAHLSGLLRDSSPDPVG